MYADTPRGLSLDGHLGAPDIINLTDYCRRLHATGQTCVHLDVSGVVGFQRAGLDGLMALVAGSALLTVTVGGAHWSQFMMMLSSAPIRDVQPLCDSIRSLMIVPTTSRST